MSDDIILKQSVPTSIIKINTPGGVLTVKQAVDLDQLDFTPDPELEDRTIRATTAKQITKNA